MGFYTLNKKGRCMILMKEKHVGEKRLKSMQAKYAKNALVMRNKSGMQTSETWNCCLRRCGITPSW